MDFGNGFQNFFFSGVPFLVFIIFIIVIMLFMTTLLKAIKESAKNNKLPEKSEPARIINKRTHTWGGRGNMSARTTYYITFELENDERLEVPVSSASSGLYIEGDTGVLIHKGTKFINFEREAN